jgi:hypothetical protein
MRKNTPKMALIEGGDDVAATMQVCLS